MKNKQKKPTAKKSTLTLVEWLPERRKLSDLIPYERNPRTITPERLAKLKERITSQGYRNPITIDEKNTILAGHQRLKVLKELVNAGEGDIEVFVMVPPEELRPLNAKLRREIIASDNVSWGADDWNVLMEDYTREELADWGLDVSGWKEEAKIEEDEIPVPPENPITKLGDIWELGDHRLMCGDSTQIDAVEKLMGGGMADMLLTDPPYNVAYEGKTKAALTIQNDKMADNNFRQFLTDAFTAANAVMKAGAVFYIWHADSEGYNFRGACHDTGWKVRQCLIWKKQTMVMGRQDYHWKHEPCLYGWKDGSGHLWAADRKQTTILEFDRPNRNAEHPTMKPVELFEYQMLNNTKGSDVVLDTFGGSGTTIIAAESHGRHARLMELDPKYCDVIIKRWENLTGKKAKLLPHD